MSTRTISLSKSPFPFSLGYPGGLHVDAVSRLSGLGSDPHILASLPLSLLGTEIDGVHERGDPLLRRRIAE